MRSLPTPLSPRINTDRVRVGDILDELPNGAHLRASVKERLTSAASQKRISTAARALLRCEPPPLISRNRCYGFTGTSTRLSPVLTRTRRSIRADWRVGTVAREGPSSRGGPILMLFPVPSGLRGGGQTWAPAQGWPAGFKSRTA